MTSSKDNEMICYICLTLCDLWLHVIKSTQVVLGFPCGSDGNESACNAGDLGLIPGLGRSPGKGKGYPLQYSGLENSTGCIVHGIAKNRTRLTDFHSGGSGGKEPTCQCWRHKRCRFDPWVGKILWRRAWQPTPVFLPGDSHEQRSLIGNSP